MHVNGTPASGPGPRRPPGLRRAASKRGSTIALRSPEFDPRQVLVEHLDRAALARGDGLSDLGDAQVGILSRVSEEQLARDTAIVAEHDAPSRSPLYAELARGVAEDRELIALARRAAGRQAPAEPAVRRLPLVAGTPAGWPEFEPVLGERRDEIEAVMLERRTQTNEAARCALMLPLLAPLPQPLALLEVGASAGLCLLPDRYGYDYDGHRLGDGPPVLRCTSRRPAAPGRAARGRRGAPASTSTRSTSPTTSRSAGWSC